MLNIKLLIQKMKMKTVIRKKYTGCLIGAMLGDIIGAAVEGESSNYIKKEFPQIEDIFKLQQIPEIFGGHWIFGKYTDDTQMMLSLTEWLLHNSHSDGQALLRRFSQSYEAWRRYGPGTSMILEHFRENRIRWNDLAYMMFPNGSYGNGAAMRVAPVGLYYRNNNKSLLTIVKISTQVTHAHDYAIQGASIQAIAVATAANSMISDFNPMIFLNKLFQTIEHFKQLLQDTTPYINALKVMRDGIQNNSSSEYMASKLGNGVASYESVPMAIYCFLKNYSSYETTIRDAVYAGGDTDTIASMAGAISGAFLGEPSIPTDWFEIVKEKTYCLDKVRSLGNNLADTQYKNT